MRGCGHERVFKQLIYCVGLQAARPHTLCCQPTRDLCELTDGLYCAACQVLELYGVPIGGALYGLYALVERDSINSHSSYVNSLVKSP